MQLRKGNAAAATQPKLEALEAGNCNACVASNFGILQLQFLPLLRQRGNAIAINAFVPLANMFGYINTLRSMSSGRAQFTMQFDHYEPVPQNISDEIQAKYA